ncbi:PhzF family phenazine biosynthesis protein [Kushneria aurantia]|uniref:PhzF family phenazine biosynthesis protein n=1 Tax=Kushneria aurantia TaxID=504092 RepID=A0ABV6G0Q4_9GAMM|nr:PhzF family phenazine biosynthesis protein [Kushneria aurantia]
MPSTASPHPFANRTAHRYYLLDVFTDTPFAGNPLAVFTEAETLDGATMARIAGELNLSETVFITRHESPERVHLRIFTPGCELPFAGHPTIGTACLLRALGRHDGSSPLTLVEGVGDVPIHFDSNLARLITAQPLNVRPSTLTPPQAAAVLGLDEAAIVGAPVIASCGVPYHLIELTDRDQLARIELDSAVLKSCCPDPATSYLYAFVDEGEYHLRARMFAPLTGTPEDPATGSAAAPLIGYLASRHKDTPVLDWQITQGVEMGRPSHIQGRVERHGGGISAIHIAGGALVAGEGALYL